MCMYVRVGGVRLCVCVYVYYVCIIYVYVNVHICVCVRAYVWMDVHACMYTYRRFIYTAWCITCWSL